MKAYCRWQRDDFARLGTLASMTTSKPYRQEKIAGF
jgi:hypothetical protein